LDERVEDNATCSSSWQPPKTAKLDNPNRYLSWPKANSWPHWTLIDEAVKFRPSSICTFLCSSCPLPLIRRSQPFWHLSLPSSCRWVAPVVNMSSSTQSSVPPSGGPRVRRSPNASMRPPSCISTRDLSPFRGLSQWDRPPTPPLIQLDPSAPLDWFAKQNETSHKSNLVHHQPSLLDLDDIQDQQRAGPAGPSDYYSQKQRQLEADYKLAKALQEELNAVDAGAFPSRCARSFLVSLGLQD
jgi:hypothetical protein